MVADGIGYRSKLSGTRCRRVVRGSVTVPHGTEARTTARSCGLTKAQLREPKSARRLARPHRADHGAGDVGWHGTQEAELRSRGHDTVAPALPCDDDSAGLSEYADAVVQAIGDRTDLVVVAQSSGGFTAPIVCDRVPVRLLVLVAPMIPTPREVPADYWVNTRYGEEVRESFDEPIALFYQDVPPELAAEALKRDGAVRGPGGGARPRRGLRFPRECCSPRDRLFPRLPAGRGPGAPGHHTRRDRRRRPGAQPPEELAERPRHSPPRQA
jgi:hypothetical protein